MRNNSNTPARLLQLAAIIATTSIAPADAQPDAFPSRPITILVPFAPGGRAGTS